MPPRPEGRGGTYDYSRSLVREDAEDVAALAIAIIRSLLRGGTLLRPRSRTLALLTLALSVVPVVVVPTRRHARHRSRRRAIWRLRTIAQPLRHVCPLRGGRRSTRRAARWRRRARATQALVVNPVICATQRMLTPRRIVFWREARSLEVVQPAHRQHEPVFALLHHSIEQVLPRHAALLHALDSVKLIGRRAE